MNYRIYQLSSSTWERLLFISRQSYRALQSHWGRRSPPLYSEFFMCVAPAYKQILLYINCYSYWITTRPSDVSIVKWHVLLVHLSEPCDRLETKRSSTKAILHDYLAKLLNKMSNTNNCYRLEPQIKRLYTLALFLSKTPNRQFPQTASRTNTGIWTTLPS